MSTFIKYFPNEEALMVFASQLAGYVVKGVIIFLSGPLGAGKTTFSRGFLQGLGHHGTVKSPTYTLVEPYELEGISVFHFDFYRISHPEELDFMGIKDYFSPTAICLIEWPEMGKGMLPLADLSCYIEPLREGRQITLEAHSARGNLIMEQWANNQNDS